MTRSWQFTLTTGGTWYNLWTDLVAKDTSFTDPTFTTASYTPSRVQNIIINPNSATIFISEDSNKELGQAIAVNTPYIKIAFSNTIDLMSFYLRSATSGATVDVSIASN